MTFCQYTMPNDTNLNDFHREIFAGRGLASSSGLYTVSRTLFMRSKAVPSGQWRNRIVGSLVAKLASPHRLVHKCCYAQNLTVGQCHTNTFPYDLGWPWSDIRHLVSQFMWVYYLLRQYIYAIILWKRPMTFTCQDNQQFLSIGTTHRPHWMNE